MDESLAALEAAVDESTERARALLPRIRGRDHTVWSPRPHEVADRLGWLDAPHLDDQRRAELGSLADGVVADGIGDVVLVGMGGSSLFPEVLAATLGPAPGHPRLAVVDTTDPRAVLDLERRTAWATSLLLAASKSGTTVEMRCLLARYLAVQRAAADDRGAEGVLAITDPGTPLAERARREGFRGVLSAPPDVGGRYSALTVFGLGPAALLGVDLEGLLAPAREVLESGLAGAGGDGDPVRLGAVLATAARLGRDKLTLLLPDDAPGLGAWIEQLVAESTGKSGIGLLPVLDEAADADRFGDDRLVIAVGGQPGLDAVADAGHPVVRLQWRGRADLGAEVARWELATAIAGALLGINPFDQPDVELAKRATSRMLERGEDLPPVEGAGAALDALAPGGYVALLGFVTPGGGDHRALSAAAQRLRARTSAPVTVGVGPRYLHSTGQLHKGGPEGGVFLVGVGDDPEDAEVPGEDGLTFSRLKRAQAAGDLEALRSVGRTVAHVAPDTPDGR